MQVKFKDRDIYVYTTFCFLSIFFHGIVTLMSEQMLPSVKKNAPEDNSINRLPINQW